MVSGFTQHHCLHSELFFVDIQDKHEEIQCMFTWVVGVGGDGSTERVGFRQREGRGR